MVLLLVEPLPTHRPYGESHQGKLLTDAGPPGELNGKSSFYQWGTLSSGLWRSRKRVQQTSTEFSTLDPPHLTIPAGPGTGPRYISSTSTSDVSLTHDDLSRSLWACDNLPCSLCLRVSGQPPSS